MLARNNKSIIFLLLLSLCSYVYCLAPATQVSQYRHKEWNTTDGIPYSAVRSVYQSSEGYIWLGTRAGIARFDGVSFTSYVKENQVNFYSDEANGFAEDEKGRLYVATAKGFLVWEKNKWKRPPEQLREFDQTPILWISNFGSAIEFGTERGLYRFKNDVVNKIQLPAKVKFNGLVTVVHEVENEWVIIAEHSWMIVDKEAHSITAEGGKKFGWAFTCSRDAEGNYYVGHPHGITKISPRGVITQITHLGGIKIKAVRLLHFDSEYSLWIGTRNSLFRYANNELQEFEVDGVHDFANALSVVEDFDRNLWFGTGTGLVQLADAKVVNETTRDGLPARSILSIIEDKNKTRWVGAMGGGVQALHKDGTRKQFTKEDGLIDDFVINMDVDSQNNLWVGYYGKGIGKISQGRVTNYYNEVPGANSRYNSLDIGPDDKIWLVTLSEGVLKFENGQLSPAINFELGTISALLPIEDGRLWAATNTSVALWNDKAETWEQKFSIAERFSLPAREIIRGEDGNIWIVRDGAVIHKINTHDNTLDTYSLPASVGILSYGGVIHKEKLWLNFRNGIVSIDIKYLQETEMDEESGARKIMKFGFFNEVDGMLASGPNLVTGQNIYVSGNMIHFATSNGIALINTDNIRQYDSEPPVIIEKVVFDNHAYHPSELVEVPPINKEAVIYYNAFSLSDASQTRFKYKLEGFHDEWVDAASERKAYFGSLGPGEYEFKVIAANEDGVWNQQGASVSFYIQQRFYQRVWFWIFLIGMFPCVIWFYLHRKELIHKEKTEALERGISERTRDLVQAKEQADRANKAKSEFIAVMSHEIRTPLSGVVGMLNILKNKANTPDQINFIETAQESADTLIKILNDVLDTSKIESGKLTLEQKAFNLSKVVVSAAESLQSRADEKGINLDVEINCSEDLMIVGDAVRLRQILSNLLGNAIKFTDRGSVAVGVDTDAVSTHQVELKCSVKDTGIGIPEDALGRIFNDFEQADTSTTREYGGTGLGLSIVKKISELMDGDIEVTSSVGKGSCFVFTGLFGSQKHMEYEEKNECLRVGNPLSGMAPMKLLVAEDNATNRLVISEILAPLGHEVVFAFNGKEALEKLEDGTFDLVLMDTRMPIMDGLEAVKRIRSLDNDKAEIPIVTVSANVAYTARQQCFDAGVNGFIAKPIDENELCSMIQRFNPILNIDKVVSKSIHEEVGGEKGQAFSLSADELLGSVSSEGEPQNDFGLSDDARQAIKVQFVKDAPKLIASILQANREHDLETIAISAHSLKSNCRYLSRKDLSQLCEFLEHAADEKNIERVESTIPKVKNGVDDLIRQLSS